MSMAAVANLFNTLPAGALQTGNSPNAAAAAAPFPSTLPHAGESADWAGPGVLPLMTLLPAGGVWMRRARE
ncbi:MAG: hypothetical protein NTZ05_09095 [Chloroflexi bacterium]|nr:hypothetical protein [Chloroflexota bacterium]